MFQASTPKMKIPKQVGATWCRTNTKAAQAAAKASPKASRHSQQKISNAFIDDPFHCAHSFGLGKEIERAPYRFARVWYRAYVDCARDRALLDE